MTALLIWAILASVACIALFIRCYILVGRVCDMQRKINWMESEAQFNLNRYDEQFNELCTTRRDRDNFVSGMNDHKEYWLRAEGKLSEIENLIKEHKRG